MNKSLYSHIIDNLYKIKTSTNKISPVKINAKQNEDLKEKILYATSFLPVDRVYSERIYCISNDIWFIQFDEILELLDFDKDIIYETINDSIYPNTV